MLSSRDIVKTINRKLETTWTDIEWNSGKKVGVETDWRGRMKFIMGEYRKAGWEVRREIMLSSDAPFYDDYLIFRNPGSFQSCPPELRGVSA